jgi:Anthrone oxygenase
MRPDLYAFAAAASFLGATIYVALVEQPARLRLSSPAMIQEWRLSNRRGTLLLSVLAVVSASLAYIQFRNNGDVRWIIGGLTILASWPYAHFVMVPLNVWLANVPSERTLSPVRKLTREWMRDWGLLEWGQVLPGLGATGTFAWALMQPP